MSEGAWERIYTNPGHRHKNQHPDTDVVRFVMRNYGTSDTDRSRIKILDLGCGWGNNLRFLSDAGFDAWGIDFSRAAIRNCELITRKVMHADFFSLPFEGGCFDAIIDRNSIQCNPMKKISLILQEARRVLKEEGLLYSAMLSSTNQPSLFHADYLHNEKSELTIQDVLTLFGGFGSLSIDEEFRTYNNRALLFKQYHVIGKKGVGAE